MRRTMQIAQQTTAGQQEVETAQHLWREVYTSAQKTSTEEEEKKVLYAVAALYPVLPIRVGRPGEGMKPANELTTLDAFEGREFDINDALGKMAQTIGQTKTMEATVKAFRKGVKPWGDSEGASTKQRKSGIKNADALLQQVCKQCKAS